MPQFCRHNRFAHLCPICSRETGTAAPPPLAPRRPAPSRSGTATTRRSGRSASGLRVRRLTRAPDDGYASGLVPGLRASGDAERLAEEIGFATGRLATIATAPPGLWAEVASGADAEEAVWLAFLIALLGPLEEDDPWATIRLMRAPWAEGPDAAFGGLDAEPITGPRGSYTSGGVESTLAAYRTYAERAGSQLEALAGEPEWTPERRFARAYERLALPGFQRGARFDFLATLAAAGRLELRSAALGLGPADDTTAGAKRAFGIGDPMLLERRAAGLAEAAGAPLAALDLALASWERGERIHGGVPDDAADAAAAQSARDALDV